MIADGLTKKGMAEALRDFMRRAVVRIHDASAQSIARSRRQASSVFLVSSAVEKGACSTCASIEEINHPIVVPSRIRSLTVILPSRRCRLSERCDQIAGLGIHGSTL